MGGGSKIIFIPHIFQISNPKSSLPLLKRMEEKQVNEELDESKDNVATKEDKNEEEEVPFIVNVHILDRLIPICVGKGSQSFKWLALNATERCREQVLIIKYLYVN